MFRRTKICTGALMALGGVLASTSAPVFGQQQLERVEITGSAIRRIDAESALPVQVLKKEDIARSGATSTTDLLQRLPAIQGSFSESSSVGGGGGGLTTVSIHNIGDTRTLVLLNGHRLAQFGGQALTGFGAAMDLNAIPLAAIERVEILTDGASALYGADAIAGVVNFITRHDATEGDISIGYSAPRGGARETRISATKGFGSVAQNGFNFLLSVSADERTKLNASDRNFGKDAEIKFSANGKNYRVQQITPSAIPGNAAHDNGTLPTDPDDPEDPAYADDYTFNPYLRANGVCPDKTFRVTDGADDYCAFNFVGELEVYPIRKRKSILGSLTKAIGDQRLVADVLYSESRQISRIAPVPGAISIPAGSALHTQYLAPWGVAGDSLAYYRLYDLGKRENDDTAKFWDLKLGSEGLLFGWDYKATYTHSQSESIQKIGGYPGALAVARLRASGLLDPFVGPGSQSAAAQAAINGTAYKGYWDGGVSKLDTVSLNGSREIFSMPAGPAMLGTGISFQREDFTSKPSLFAQGKLSDPVAGTLCDPTAVPNTCDQRFGDEAATVPYGANRNAVGVFAELNLPVAKGFEITTAARFDRYSDFGNATTAKGAFRWTPSKEFLVRGSVGTGFRAPTVPQVNASLQPFGVTGEPYACSGSPEALELAAMAAALGAQCQPGTRQYDQIAGGNPDLKPEKSRQASLGMRLEPSSAFAVGADLWYVHVRNAIGQLTEDVVFANPSQYASSFTTKRDTGTGVLYLAFLADNKNLGEAYYSGIDFDVTGRTKLGTVDLTSQVTATYMLREEQQLLPGGRYYSAIGGVNEELGAVTFRWSGRWMNTFKAGNWAHTFTVNFKSGFQDQTTEVEVLDANGNPTGAREDIRLRAKEYFSLDWQTMWNPVKPLTVTVGLLNVMDVKPPLVISGGGANRGQQFGFDDRYYDSRGRTAFVNLSYKF
jgi:iron complex outermembrane receptor protein